MPVLFDSSGQNGATINGGAGTVTNPHNVNPLAPDLFAFVAVLWIGTSDTTNGTITVKFGNKTMTPQTPIRWNGNATMFQLFTLDDPDTGQQTVSATVAGMGSNGYMIFSSDSYSGVDSIGEIVIANSNSVTVTTATAAAYRVLTVHGCGGLNGGVASFGTYDLSKRSDGYVYLWPQKVSEIVMGDAPGAESVTGWASLAGNQTAVGSYGVPIIPSVVSGDADLAVAVDMSADGGLYRIGSPSKDRLWVIES